ncbi:ABC-type transport system permease protein (plasmid) [Haloferax gibbonsii]|uniref:ABC-type transport system permease protein n=2 Tax=Haloferax gibbonsii TaxID=35746 RepID=A0A871BM62_HALGI|nr:ABC-type transport system permease protein [Haloferax gibbonsii]
MITEQLKRTVRTPIQVVQNGFREQSQAGLIVRRFIQNRLGMLGLVMSLSYFGIALIGPHIMPYDASTMEVVNRLAAPSLAHPFGTDQFGRDVLSRVILGARYSLRVSVLVVSVSALAGITLGLTAGYYGDLVDGAIMRFVDIMFAFPSILLGLVVIAILGPGLNQAIIALAVAYTPIMTRITRGSAVSVRTEEYVLAAITYGERNINIMFREMLPNLISAVIVQATITFAYATLAEASLSYLGLSAQPPTPTWGVMISAGQSFLTIAPWMSLFPGLAIMYTVLGLSFLGVGLRDALDPKTDIEPSAEGGR